MARGQMRITAFFFAIYLMEAVVLLLPAGAQVTRGQKPQLPAPFESKSAGNGPSHAKPPEGFLPTVPEGFHIGIFATDFKVPRFLAVGPNGDVFVADTGGGQGTVFGDSAQPGQGERGR